MANVALRNVRKTYAGGFEAIKGIDFDVGDGQFCVLVGPSGCGKSTLLRMVAGLETITGGEIDIGGRVVNQIEPADRDIAIGGPELAADAIKAGLVDEYQLFVVPHIVGGGKRALPDGARLRLHLLDERSFASGVVYMRYALLD